MNIFPCAIKETKLMFRTFVSNSKYSAIASYIELLTNVLNINFVSITRDTGARGPQINKHLKAYLLSNITKYEHNWIIKRICQGQHGLVTESVKLIQNPSTLSII